MSPLAKGSQRWKTGGITASEKQPEIQNKIRYLGKEIQTTAESEKRVENENCSGDKEVNFGWWHKYRTVVKQHGGNSCSGKF